MFKRVIYGVLSLSLACTDQSGIEDEALPAQVQLSVAPGVDSWFSIADVSDLSLTLRDCDGGAAELDGIDEVDFLEDELLLPGGAWCGLHMEFDGPLSLQGETEDLSIFELVLDLTELDFTSDVPLQVDGMGLVLEIGEPDWVNPPTLGIQPSSTFQITSTHPQHDVLRRSIESVSGVYVDSSGDGIIGESERDAGPIWSGAGLLPGPRFMLFGAEGRTLLSDDGSEWTDDQSHEVVLRAASRSHGLILAAGGAEWGSILASLDGQSWMDLGDTGGPLLGVASSGTLAAAVGLSGRVVTSSDLISWTEVIDETTKAPIVDEDIHAIAYGGQGFLGVGEEGIRLWSSDGVIWESEPGTIHLYDVAWGQEFFVAVGEGGARKQADDSGNWATPVFGGDDLTGVAYGDGRWVAVGAGRSVISDDGVDWESFPQEFDLERVAFGSGLFLATSEDALYSSPDGIRWTATGQGEDGPLPWVVFLP